MDSISAPSKVETRLGTLDDMWFNWIIGFGAPGPDRGPGGKYLILPPGVQPGNWVQTMPGKGWNAILRLYRPLEPFFTKGWRPTEIELVK